MSRFIGGAAALRVGARLGVVLRVDFVRRLTVLRLLAVRFLRDGAHFLLRPPPIIRLRKF